MKKLNTFQKFKVLHLVNHAVAIFAVYWAIVTPDSWPWVLLGLVCFLWTGIVGVDVALHRYFSHLSFKTTKFREYILLASSVLTSLGSPAMWCSVHRLHHTTSDTDNDPHSPRTAGVLGSWFTLWPPIVIPKRHLQPFLKTPAMKFVHRNYFALNFSILIGLALIDWRLAAFGYRRYNINDLSHNNWLAAIMSLGEGWHNNHHANPGRWWQGETWYEIDPPAFMIKHFFKVDKE